MAVCSPHQPAYLSHGSNVLLQLLSDRLKILATRTHNESEEFSQSRPSSFEDFVQFLVVRVASVSMNIN